MSEKFTEHSDKVIEKVFREEMRQDKGCQYIYERVSERLNIDTGELKRRFKHERLMGIQSDTRLT